MWIGKVLYILLASMVFFGYCRPPARATSWNRSMNPANECFFRHQRGLHRWVTSCCWLNRAKLLCRRPTKRCGGMLIHPTPSIRTRPMKRRSGRCLLGWCPTTTRRGFTSVICAKCWDGMNGSDHWWQKAALERWNRVKERRDLVQILPYTETTRVSNAIEYLFFAVRSRVT